MIVENTQTQIRKGILEYCILSIIAKGETYASDIIAELKKAQLLVDSTDQHKDDMFDVDDCFVVNEVGEYFVHLLPDGKKQEFKPDWFGYNVIGK